MKPTTRRRTAADAAESMSATRHLPAEPRCEVSGLGGSRERTKEAPKQGRGPFAHFLTVTVRAGLWVPLKEACTVVVPGATPVTTPPTIDAIVELVMLQTV